MGITYSFSALQRNEREWREQSLLKNQVNLMQECYMCFLTSAAKLFVTSLHFAMFIDGSFLLDGSFTVDLLLAVYCEL